MDNVQNIATEAIEQPFHTYCSGNNKVVEKREREKKMLHEKKVRRGVEM